jgi:hypothetical protein
LREDLLNRQLFLNIRCVRLMCRITTAQTIKYRIISKCLLERLSVGSFESYYKHRLPRSTGHAAPRPSLHREDLRFVLGAYFAKKKRPNFFCLFQTKTPECRIEFCGVLIYFSKKISSLRYFRRLDSGLHKDSRILPRICGVLEYLWRTSRISRSYFSAQTSPNFV